MGTIEQTVVIVGRPNVGKSTLFNKIIKKRIAIVSDYAGVTRDRNYARITHDNKSFILVDTGGLIDTRATLQHALNAQTKLAIDEADLIVFLVDSQAGLTPDDTILAQQLRATEKPIILVANKSETRTNTLKAEEFHELGLGDPHPIAAEHNIGIYDLKAEIIAQQTQCVAPASIPESDHIVFTLIGKPNTGKSTLTNTLIGKDQVITSDIAGTTRDSIALDLTYQGQNYTIIDTAGVRRKTKIQQHIEKFSVIRSLQSISQSHVVVYMLDATDPLSDQDCKLINFIIDEGKALVIAINKADKLDKAAQKQIRQYTQEKLEFAHFAPIIMISAQHHFGIKTLWRHIYGAYQAAIQPLSTKQLTMILRHALEKNPAPMVAGRTIKMQLAHAGGSNPPTIIIHGKQTDKLPQPYKRYLSKCFYQALSLTGTPLRLFFKNTKHNPYDPG